MSPTGRRRFRKMNRRFRQRGPVGVRDRARKTTGGKARKMILVQYWGRDPLPLPAKAFTARSLVGMTQGARKRKVWAAYQTGISESWSRLCAAYRIGQKLRPCPGCPECGADSMLILRTLSRRMNLRLEIRRCNSSIIPSKFDYLAMLHRPGPAWNPVCGFGQMRIDAVRALCDVILKEGTEEFPIQWCDGSGVLPAHVSQNSSIIWTPNGVCAYGGLRPSPPGTPSQPQS